MRNGLTAIWAVLEAILVGVLTSVLAGILGAMFLSLSETNYAIPVVVGLGVTATMIRMRHNLGGAKK